MAEEPERVGQVLLGKLQVIRKLGGGGMGDVYEVEHLLTHHRRALKIVRPEFARQRRFVERLLREASIAGRLQTPYVVETLDAGRLEDESAYVLMELLQGRSLHEAIQAEKQLSQRRVANIVCQVAEGIALAHAAGIVHRDLKPENIFLVGEGEVERVKILDFGVSKLLEGVNDAATRLTREGTVLGTPFYMAPEQAAGREIDARTDIWAMGVIMYEALTGRLPFHGETVGEVLIQIGAGMYAPLPHRRADLDAGFVAVVDRALRSDARDRYPSAEALRRDLLPFASNEPAARARTISDGERAARPSSPSSPPGQARTPSSPPQAIARTPSEPPPRRAALASTPPEIRLPSEPPAPAAAAEAPIPLQKRRRRPGALETTAAILLSGALAVGVALATMPDGQAAPVAVPAPPPPAAEAPPQIPEPPAPAIGADPPSSALATTGPAPLEVGEAPAAALAAPDAGPPRGGRRRTRAEIVGLDRNPYGHP